MKKSVVISVVLVGITVVAVFGYGFYFMLNGDPTELSALEKEVTTYLTKEKSYKKDELLKVEAGYNDKIAKGYHVEVVFRDEPDVHYLYWRKDDKISQKGIEDTSVNKRASFKHKE
ncbi:DUF3139 domain-containing protein [Numidum massiliense]|uniref:DUF3139 domain-containing protein n=1 Tax=Numidum massiliense TaxID=1522315 RepID=UPI0006D59371|nr:DUF3139 domain-containing protein [Numidum massiliense]